jgi:hypothetical protein
MEDSTRKFRITTRLEAIARGLRAGEAHEESTANELGMATDDEMFELADRELGIPPVR